MFSKLYNGAKDLSKIANTVVNVKTMLDSIESDLESNIETLLVAAWACRVGIIDVIEKNNWPMTYNLFVPINNHETKMTLSEAYFMSVGRLSMKIKEADDELKNIVLDILNKGEYFYAIDEQIPDKQKSIIDR